MQVDPQKKPFQSPFAKRGSMQLSFDYPGHLANEVLFIGTSNEAWIQTVLREPTHDLAHKAV